MAKVCFLGTGSIGTRRKCTGFVINGHILFDVGYGTVNSLRTNGLDVTDITTLVISHFHPDHVGEIIYFLTRHWEFSKIGLGKKLTVIGPKGTKKVIRDYQRITISDDGSISALVEYYKELIAGVIEIGSDEEYRNENVRVTAFPVLHGDAECNGYIINIDGRRLGCTGDTSYCEPFAANIKNADVWIVDAAHLEEKVRTRHTSYQRIMQIAAANPDKIFYAVHRYDYTAPPSPSNIILPNDDETFTI